MGCPAGLDPGRWCAVSLWRRRLSLIAVATFALALTGQPAANAACPVLDAACRAGEALADGEDLAFDTTEPVDTPVDGTVDPIVDDNLDRVHDLLGGGPIDLPDPIDDEPDGGHGGTGPRPPGSPDPSGRGVGDGRSPDGPGLTGTFGPVISAASGIAPPERGEPDDREQLGRCSRRRGAKPGDRARPLRAGRRVRRDPGPPRPERPEAGARAGRLRRGGVRVSIARIRLMLADDEASILEAMSELVSLDKDIDVVGTARDAGEAIDLAELHAPDVALLDVRMPGGGGSRAAREIRRRSPETRIVALSASTDPRTVASMVRAGAVGYVGKDQPADEVLRAIHRSADGRASLVVDRLGEVAERLVEQQTRDVVRVVGRARVSAERIEEAIRGDAIHTVFQPVVGLNDGRILGVEALSRFLTKPRRSPETWFAEAADQGLLARLELATASQALGHLDAIPEGVYLSVNVSPETLREPRLDRARAFDPGTTRGDRAHGALADRGLREDERTARRASWAGLPARDRRCWEGVLRTRARRRALARSVEVRSEPRQRRGRRRAQERPDRADSSSYADQVEMEVVAEGIETVGELETLRGLGVGAGQGFLLGRPGPIPSTADGSWEWPLRRHPWAVGH